MVTSFFFFPKTRYISWIVADSVKNREIHAGGGEDWSPDSPMITFCSGPVAGKRSKIKLQPQNMNFICNAAKRYLHVIARLP